MGPRGQEMMYRMPPGMHPGCPEYPATDADRQRCAAEWEKLKQEHYQKGGSPQTGPFPPGAIPPHGAPVRHYAPHPSMMVNQGGVPPHMMMPGHPHPQMMAGPGGPHAVVPQGMPQTVQAAPPTTSASRKRNAGSRTAGGRGSRMARPPSGPMQMQVPPEFQGMPQHVMRRMMQPQMHPGFPPGQGPPGPGYMMYAPNPQMHMQANGAFNPEFPEMMLVSGGGRMPGVGNGPPNVQVMSSMMPVDQDGNMMPGNFVPEDMFNGAMDGQFPGMNPDDNWTADCFPLSDINPMMTGPGQQGMPAGPQGPGFPQDPGMMGGNMGIIKQMSMQNANQGALQRRYMPQQFGPGMDGGEMMQQQPCMPANANPPTSTGGFPRTSSASSAQGHVPQVNNTYVNATLSIQQMNIQNVAAHSGPGHQQHGGGNQQQSMNAQQMNVQQNVQQQGPVANGQNPQFVLQGVETAIVGAAYQAMPGGGPPGTGPPNVQIRMAANPNAPQGHPGMGHQGNFEPRASMAGPTPPASSSFANGGYMTEPITNLESKIPSGTLNYYPQDHGGAPGPQPTSGHPGMQAGHAATAGMHMHMQQQHLSMDHQQMMMQQQQRSIYMSQQQGMPPNGPQAPGQYAQGHPGEYRMHPKEGVLMDGEFMSMQMSQTVKTGSFSADDGGAGFDASRGFSSFEGFQQQLYATPTQRKTATSTEHTSTS